MSSPTPDLTALIATFQEAQNLIERRRWLAEQIARHQAEDTALRNAVALTWGARIQDMLAILQAYVIQTQSEIPPEEPPVEEPEPEESPVEEPV